MENKLLIINARWREKKIMSGTRFVTKKMVSLYFELNFN